MPNVATIDWLPRILIARNMNLQKLYEYKNHFQILPSDLLMGNKNSNSADTTCRVYHSLLYNMQILQDPFIYSINLSILDQG